MSPDSPTPDSTDTGPAEPDERTADQVFADAVRVLTEATRLTRPVMVRDEAASEGAAYPVWVPGPEREPADWAEFVTLALAGAAANAGGIEVALSGRPGSWEADGVRNLLTSTVGHDEASLLEHRTEPVTVDLYVDVILADLDVWSTYDQAGSALGVRADQIATTDPIERERQEEAIADLEERLEEQRVADWSAYGQDLATAVRQVAVELFPDLQVPVVVNVDLDTYRPPAGYDDLGITPAGRLRQAAIDRTPLPGDGRAPLDRLDNPTNT